MTTKIAPTMVGMSEIKLLQNTGHFTCLGLGSCIGLLAVDTVAKVAGMIHIMLPQSFEGKPVDKVGKFADTGVPELLKMLEAKGAIISRMKVAYAGGAQVFQFGNNADKKLEIGLRNAEAVKALIAQYGLRVVGHDVGGRQGRTVNYDLSDGRFMVRTVTEGERELCKLH